MSRAAALRVNVCKNLCDMNDVNVVTYSHCGCSCIVRMVGVITIHPDAHEIMGNGAYVLLQISKPIRSR